MSAQISTFERWREISTTAYPSQLSQMRILREYTRIFLMHWCNSEEKYRTSRIIDRIFQKKMLISHLIEQVRHTFLVLSAHNNT